MMGDWTVTLWLKGGGAEGIGLGQETGLGHCYYWRCPRRTCGFTISVLLFGRGFFSLPGCELVDGRLSPLNPWR